MALPHTRRDASELDDLEEKAPARAFRSELVDIPMDDDDDEDEEEEHDASERFGGETDRLQQPRGRASWTRAAPTIVQLPHKAHGAGARSAVDLNVRSDNTVAHSPALSTLDDEAIDADVFNALPVELQHEILTERAARIALTTAQEARGTSSFTSQDAMQRDDVTSAAVSDSCWVCRVCTFANHPQLAECEMCETLCVQPDEYVFGRHEVRDAAPIEDATNGTQSRTGSGSKGTELYAKLSQRLGSSTMSKSLRKIRLPATPAATKLTMKDDPTAEDLLVVATAKVQKLQSTASETLRHAKESLIARTHANKTLGSRRSSSSDHHLPSAAAVSELRALQRDLHCKCEPGDDAYESLLVRLWDAIYQDAPAQQTQPSLTGTAVIAKRAFARVSDGWTAMGFQGTNPDTDFRGGGVLALKCLVYAFEAFPARMLEIVAHQTPSAGKKWYPVCVAGVNVTCMLAGALQLGNGTFETTAAPFWPLFEEPSAFYQLFFYSASRCCCGCVDCECWSLLLLATHSWCTDSVRENGRDVAPPERVVHGVWTYVGPCCTITHCPHITSLTHLSLLQLCSKPRAACSMRCSRRVQQHSRTSETLQTGRSSTATSLRSRTGRSPTRRMASAQIRTMSWRTTPTRCSCPVARLLCANSLQWRRCAECAL